MAQILNKIGRGGKVLDSVFIARLEGGPALAAKLRQLDRTLAGQAAKAAVVAMGNVFANAWADRVPVDHGDYRDEMRNPGVVKSGINTGHDPEGLAVLKGASGSVGPRMRPKVSGLDDNQQPYVYAAVLEFGGATGMFATGSTSKTRTGTYHVAEPSARPAFDASKGAAVAAAETSLRASLEKIVQ